MKITTPKISPFLWFDTQAEEAAKFYTGIFPNSRITQVSRYGEGAPQPAGTAMTVSFELAGQQFVALNGGPGYPFTQAVSFVVNCEDQAEVDHYWDKLAQGGKHIQCGWLTDPYGLPWQVCPVQVFAWMQDPDPARASRVMQALWQMTKIEIAGLERAYNAV